MQNSLIISVHTKFWTTDVFRKTRLPHTNKQIPNKSYTEQGDYFLSCVTIIFG